MKTDNGKVFLVGAGPGDPGLLTMKAHQLLREADAVFHDALVPQAILDIARSDAEIIYVGKRCNDGQDQTVRQESINGLLIRYARQGMKCVRLKAGDPFIFGRGVEEVRALVDNGIEVEVVPGITAGIAAACMMHIPLTERNRMTSVFFCTGHTAHYSMAQMDAVIALLKEGSSMVMYMGLKNLETVIGRLLENGLPAGLPVCAAARVSMPDQQLVCGTLETIGALVRRQDLGTPAIFVIGEHVMPAGIHDALLAHPDICCSDDDNRNLY